MNSKTTILAALAATVFLGAGTVQAGTIKFGSGFGASGLQQNLTKTVQNRVGGPSAFQNVLSGTQSSNPVLNAAGGNRMQSVHNRVTGVFGGRGGVSTFTTPDPDSTTPVPLPASALLLLGGLGGLSLMRRKRG